MTQPVLHLDFISLKNPADAGQRSRLAGAAAELMDLEQVTAGGVIDCSDGSDFDLIFFFVLTDYQALEPFGTDPRYVAFLQKNVAPALKTFAGADVAIEGEVRFPQRSFAACLALTAPEETYDFEIREALQRWVEQSGAALDSIGIAVGEVRGFRGVSLIFGEEAVEVGRPAVDKFGVTYATGVARLLG